MSHHCAIQHWHISTMIMLSVTIALFLISELHEVSARPTWSMPSMSFLPQFPTTTQCEINETLMDICQRCAKVTKSNLAYPMCCNDSEGAIQWCKDYIYFGISS